GGPGADGHAPDRRAAGATLLGLRVADLDETLARLTHAGARVLTPLQLTPHGPRAVVEDPDGRAVELTSLA
ncbi:MAG: VOC family protein, partial [Myxococcales bacterium]